MNDDKFPVMDLSILWMLIYINIFYTINCGQYFNRVSGGISTLFKAENREEMLCLGPSLGLWLVLLEL